MRAKCKCGQVLDVPREMIGKVVECPSCGLRLRIQGPKIDRDRPVTPKVVKETPGDAPQPRVEKSVERVPEEGTPAQQAIPPSSSAAPDQILPCPSCRRSVRIPAGQAGAGSVCPYCGFELQPVPARPQTTYRRPPRAPADVAAPDPLVYQWIFAACLGYLSLLVFLPWVKFIVNINAIRIMDLSFHASKAEGMLSGIAILVYIGSLVGGWVALGGSFAGRTGIPRMRLWFGLAGGMLILFCVGWYAATPADTGPIRLSIFDFIAPTFYIGIAAAIGGFIASVIAVRQIGPRRQVPRRRYR